MKTTTLIKGYKVVTLICGLMIIITVSQKEIQGTAIVGLLFFTGLSATIHLTRKVKKVGAPV
jgi:hypothetical protein